MSEEPRTLVRHYISAAEPRENLVDRIADNAIAEGEATQVGHAMQTGFVVDFARGDVESAVYATQRNARHGGVLSILHEFAPDCMRHLYSVRLWERSGMPGAVKGINKAMARGQAPPKSSGFMKMFRKGGQNE